ncbi:MAG TPA: hypothetical protein DHW22_13485 [Planctomycetaceae bacterium]|nr:hypothetical protein [Planctomycetaceae bacterium]
MALGDPLTMNLKCRYAANREPNISRLSVFGQGNTQGKLYVLHAYGKSTKSLLLTGYFQVGHGQVF